LNNIATDQLSLFVAESRASCFGMNGPDIVYRDKLFEVFLGPSRQTAKTTSSGITVNNQFTTYVDDSVIK
jgi:hypothetical protein